MATPNVRAPQLAFFGARGAIQIPLRGKHGRGTHATVDAEDADLLARKWTARQGGYARCTRTGEDMYRIICERAHGPAPEGHECDHIDGDPRNNRRANLRWATRTQNVRNRRGFGRKTAKGYRGVGELRRASGARFYQPRLYIEGKTVALGSYDDAEVAARVYDAYASLYYEGFAVLNFPGDEPWSLDECERQRLTSAKQAQWAKPAWERLNALTGHDYHP